jgi:membrane associated rhomboid family serine protease
MPASSDPATDPPADAAPDLVLAGTYPTAEDAADRGLVILAMGWPYWLVPGDGRFELRVEPGAEAGAREQLARYERESAGWPPVPPPDDAARRRVSFLTPLLWAALTTAAFRQQHVHRGWTEAGALDAHAVLANGEWWRVATALFLHADLGHLLSNLVSGVLVFAAVITTLGRLRGWSLIALAACGGNLLTASLRSPDTVTSIGASTAIFAGFGLLTGRAVAAAAAPGRTWRWRSAFVPLASGLTLLAWLGAGGPRVDLGAHLAGFAAGGLLGALAQWTGLAGARSPREPAPQSQNRSPP